MRSYNLSYCALLFCFCFVINDGWSQKSYFPSDQRNFVNGAFSDLNAAWIGRLDRLEVGFERSADWLGFEGNPETGLLYFSSKMGSTNSFVGIGLKSDGIAAFKRKQINGSYAYDLKLTDNEEQPIRLILGLQPQLELFRVDYDDYQGLYPAAVPPDGLNQATFGINAGFLVTNTNAVKETTSSWYAGLSTRRTGISLKSQETDITNITLQEWVSMVGIRQMINDKDLFLDVTAFGVHSDQGTDLSFLLKMEKFDPTPENASGGWLGFGIKGNTSSFAGAKQLVLQFGLIKELFKGEDKLVKIGFFAETDAGPIAFVGNRIGLLLVYQK